MRPDRRLPIAVRGVLSRLLALAFFVAGLSTPSDVLAKYADDRPPNIILILADDLGFNQVGAYGDSPIKTPNIDKLAAGGIRFTSAYSGNTVCSPSRVSLFTGRDSRLMENNSNNVELEEIDITIADILKRAGYDTGLFGKYSIGSKMGVTDPLSKGFDTWFGFYAALEGHRQYPYFLWRDNEKVRIKENENLNKGAYAQELFTNEAIKFIRRRRDNPFFAMVSYTTPHGELAAPEEFTAMYDGQFPETPYTGMSTGVSSDPYAWYYPEPVENPHATLAGMVTALDSYVGRIVKALEQQRITDNTIIIVTSDNGPHHEGGADPEFFRAAYPFKGIKRDMYEGGIRVPMVVSWPSGVQTPRVDDTPWAFADVMPTFADLAGVDMKRVPRARYNGLSIAPLLQTTPDEMPERTLYWEFSKLPGDANPGVVGETFQAARRGKWKAVKYGRDGAVELYDLQADPGESNNLVVEYPDIHHEFVALFAEHIPK